MGVLLPHRVRTFLLGASFLLYAGVLASIVRVVAWDDSLNLYKPFFRPLLALAAILGGGLLGGIRGAIVKSDRKYNLEKIGEHLDVLMKGAAQSGSEESPRAD